MIKINKFASLAYQTVAYLSFNIDIRPVEVRNRPGSHLLIELKAGTYQVHSDGPLMLRKINGDAPMMEYVYLRQGVYTFIDAIDVPHRLLLLD